jgi:two-component system OmpR family response regulator
MRVLLVEGDLMIGEAMRDAFEDASCEVDWARDVVQAICSVRWRNYDAVVIDPVPPNSDIGQIVAAVSFYETAVPILVLAARDNFSGRHPDFDNGAVVFILQPFEISELFACMHAAIRRRDHTDLPVISNGRIWLNLVTREARVGPRSVQLAAGEIALLRTLMARPGAIIPYVELEACIERIDPNGESNTVQRLIESLCSKLGSDVVTAVRGLGWCVSKKLDRYSRERWS